MFYRDAHFIEGFVKLLYECHNIVLNIYKSDFEKYIKNDNSPVTIADKQCNTFIVKYLENLNIEDSCIISEESNVKSYTLRKKHKWTWLVDPLDGTKEFIKKNGEFTVNIGLCYNGVPVFGFVGIPCTGDIFYGIEGIGSFKISEGIKTKLDISNKHKYISKLLTSPNKNNNIIRIVCSRSHLNNKTKTFIDKFNKTEIVNTGSSIKLLLIADDKADIYPRLGPTSEWDTCAAHAVVKYANGNVYIYDDKNREKLIELKYNRENIINPSFIVF